MDIKKYAETIAFLINGEVVEVRKNGVPLTGIMPAEGNIKPTVYINGMYDRGIPVGEAATAIRDLFSSEQHPPVTEGDFYDSLQWEQVKDNLRIRLQNKKAGEEVSAPASPEGMDDLCYVPYVRTQLGPEKGWVKVNNGLLDMWGVSADEVIRIARENSDRDEYIIKPLGDVITELLAEQDGDFSTDYNSENPMSMVIITNTDRYAGVYGAVAKADELKKLYPNGYILLPSSIHEMLALDAKHYDPVLETMVQEVNETSVDPVDQLGDHLYVMNTVIAGRSAA